MGFLEKIGKGLDWAINKVERGLDWTINKVEKGLDWVVEKIEKLDKKLQGPKIKEPITTTKPPKNGGTSVSNEEYEKKQTQLEAEVIAEYQEEIEERAIKRESSVKNLYSNIYNNYISKFKGVFDEDVIKNLKVFIKTKENIFKNRLRNEVNSKVNPSCKKWQRLIARNASHNEIQSYCDRVYTDADNNLLDLLQEAIEDTNDYISKCIVKYNEDEALALAKLKKSLINLTADDESNAKELKQIAEELAVAEFIANEATPIQ